MKAALIHAPFEVKFEQVPTPQVRSGQVLVQMERVGVCGTDIHVASVWARTWQRFGHEMVGTISVVAEDIEDLCAGDLVAVEPTAACWVCRNCMDGRMQDCVNWEGSRRLEGLAQYVAVPRRHVWKIEGLSANAATLIEPMTVSLDLIRLSEIEMQHTVAIVGSGPIGIMAAAIAKHKGAHKVFMVAKEADTYRFALCESLGVDRCFNVDSEDVVKGIRSATDGRGVDRVLNTANAQSIVASLDLCANGAILVYCGFDTSEEQAGALLNMNDFHRRKLQLRASWAAPAAGFPLANQLLKDGVVPADRLITHEFPFEEVEHALRTVHQHADGVIKAVIRISDEGVKGAEKSVTRLCE